MKNLIKKLTGTPLKFELTQEDYVKNCDELFVKENSILMEKMNKTLSEWLNEKAKNIDCLMALFLIEKR